MKTIKILLIAILMCPFFTTQAQNHLIIPDLSKISDSNLWTLHNRDLIPGIEVHLNAEQGDGLLWSNDLVFENGTIELDIKGKNERGKSFLGIAFHGLNDSTYDVIYFRPFNFEDPTRNGHSVQYISHPEFPWYKLREEHPEKYENAVLPVPEPNGWFHATIIIKYPVVKVYVDNAKEPSLTINQLSSRKKGWIGFWVGNGSEGYFKNLEISKE